MTSSNASLTVTLEHDIDEQYQYQPGELIRGRLTVEVYRTLYVESIYATISGEGVVAWDDPYEGTFQNNEVYINESTVIVDMKHKKPLGLQKGFHDFDFEYQLPKDIPSSFIGKYGSVTYILKGIVQGERNADCLISTEPFLVLRRLELPEKAFEEVDKYISQRLWSTCSFGKVKCHVVLPKTGYIAGEDILVQAEVANKSPVRVTAIQGALIMNSRYRAQKRYMEFKQMVNKRRDEYELIKGDGRRWQNVRVSIPPYIPESFLEGCDIIEVSYVFQFRVETSGGREIRAEFPILLGAHPRASNGVMEEKVDGVMEDRNRNDMNTKWTPGPRLSLMFSEEKEKENGDINDIDYHKWYGGQPAEMRPESEIRNPIFRNESMKHQNKHSKDKSIDDYDSVREVIEKTQL